MRFQSVIALAVAALLAGCGWFGLKTRSDAASDVPGEITIGVRYTVRANNTRFNLVYPFYLNEAEGRRP